MRANHTRVRNKRSQEITIDIAIRLKRQPIVRVREEDRRRRPQIDIERTGRASVTHNTEIVAVTIVKKRKRWPPAFSDVAIAAGLDPSLCARRTHRLGDKRT
ncbi:MAG: hypothetical protein M0D54_13935 [Hyphomonadaceae bacterium JAD_PAG50586_4]|nr:MAG: hypothetical protein M0D54_13935 [Hyphomonadaceae bacterium JAD_PAG50586_4]